MSYLGYVFPSAAAIRPYVEKPRTGPTSRFCADLSKRLHCHVAAGYPERLGDEEEPTPTCATGDDGVPIVSVGANSAVLYGPDGNFIGNYRKTCLYKTDVTWAHPGTGFTTYELPHPLHTMTMGICMDLNAEPPDEMEDATYELARHCVEKNANVLLLLNAWLDSKEELDILKDWHTLNYWAARLRPLWERREDVEDEGSDNGSEDSDYDAEYRSEEEEASSEMGEALKKPILHGHPGQETIVIICNRCGEENGELFAGTSAVFSMIRGSGRPKLLHAMDRQTEDVAIWEI
ncbi:hypothetical protein NM688_g4992 [Phlebia brevispora]|uniref:Uncharacterized protein n=1 Tax=Phlebia brevispora TaxID=194682 RepID=A0ACC1T1L6_9APHY|nr:hypothetical protein NM688_g4992 [Phlebia brevispora]